MDPEYCDNPAYTDYYEDLKDLKKHIAWLKNASAQAEDMFSEIQGYCSQIDDYLLEIEEERLWDEFHKKYKNVV